MTLIGVRKAVRDNRQRNSEPVRRIGASGFCRLMAGCEHRHTRPAMSREISSDRYLHRCDVEFYCAHNCMNGAILQNTL